MMPLEDLRTKFSNESGMESGKVEKLILDKKDELSGLVSKEGAAYIVGRELGISMIKEGRQEFKIKNLVTDLSYINLEAKVLKISTSRAFEKKPRGRNGFSDQVPKSSPSSAVPKMGQVQNAFLGDETGTVTLVLWNDDVSKLSGIGEGDSVKISNALSKKSSRTDEVELSMTKRGSIEKIEKKIEVAPSGFRQNSSANALPRTEIKDLKENSYGEVKACLVHLFRRTPFYSVCPNCGSTVDRQNNCKSHGLVEPQKNLMLSGIIDDGTENMRVILFREMAERVFGLKAAGADFSDLNAFYDGVKTIGTEFIFSGKAKKNSFSGEVEFVANNVEYLDVKKECEVLLKAIGK
jgi:ssDNA-binding replication factor A large subunit